MAVAVSPGPPFQHAAPVAVVNPVHTLHEVNTAPTYDVSPDGRRFLFIRAPELDIRSLTIVQNWNVEVSAILSKSQRGVHSEPQL